MLFTLCVCRQSAVALYASWLLPRCVDVGSTGTGGETIQLARGRLTSISRLLRSSVQQMMAKLEGWKRRDG